MLRVETFGATFIGAGSREVLQSSRRKARCEEATAFTVKLEKEGLLASYSIVVESVVLINITRGLHRGSSLVVLRYSDGSLRKAKVCGTRVLLL